MAVGDAAMEPQERMQRLLGYLALDPDNANLIADCAQAAFDAGDLDRASRLAARWEAASPGGPAPLNLRGLIALAERRPQAAAAIFTTLREQDERDPALAVNLAWALAMTEDAEGALALLDDDTVAAAPAAAVLKIQVMHRLGLVQEGVATGLELAALRPGDRPLMGALSTLALDAGNLALARSCALGSEGSAEGLTTLGLLALSDEHLDEAGALFDTALGKAPDNPRAQLGKGLELLAKGEAAAAEHIDRAAQLFGRHLGSWIAAGWAYFVAGEIGRAKSCFEQVLALDDTFAEAHGALAVIAITESRLEEARRGAEVAARLDRNCLSAALATTMLLKHDGRPEAAERVRQMALNRPLGADGKTIAQAMAKLAIAVGGRPERR